MRRRDLLLAAPFVGNVRGANDRIVIGQIGLGTRGLYEVDVCGKMPDVRIAAVADAETGHRSVSACLLANIAYKMGRKIRWDSHAERTEGDAEAGRLLGKQYREPWVLPAV